MLYILYNHFNRILIVVPITTSQNIEIAMDV